MNIGNILSVSIQMHTGNTIPIPNSTIKTLYVIEDIYSLSITGKIIFTDVIGFMEKYGIIGDELVTIIFGNTNNSMKTKTLDMKIHKIVSIKPSKESSITSNLDIEAILVDKYYHLWHTNKWHKGWFISEYVKVSVTTIIKDIFNYVGVLNDIEFSSTVLRQFDMHNRSPAECIQWLMDRSRSADTPNGYGYLLYPLSKYGIYNMKLVTLEKLMSTPEYIGPKGDSVDAYTYTFNSINKNQINRIRHVQIRKPDYNSLKSLLGGTVLGFDSLTKTFINKKYTYKDAVKKFTILGKYTLFPKSIANFKDAGTKIELDGTDDPLIADNIFYNNWIKEYCTQQLVEITVTGHEDRYIGGKIKIRWPSVEGLNSTESPKTEYINKQYTGDYLVKSITNYFSDEVEGGWMQKLVLIKNGYDDSPSSKNLITK